MNITDLLKIFHKLSELLNVVLLSVRTARPVTLKFLNKEIFGTTHNYKLDNFLKLPEVEELISTTLHIKVLVNLYKVSGFKSEKGLHKALQEHKTNICSQTVGLELAGIIAKLEEKVVTFEEVPKNQSSAQAIPTSITTYSLSEKRKAVISEAIYIQLYKELENMLIDLSNNYVTGAIGN